MSDQVIVSPENMRNFAAFLRQFSDELRDSTGLLQAKFGELGGSWRDQEHMQFEAEFSDTVASLSQFLGTADEYVDYLLRKAERAEAYLDQR